MAVKRRQKVEGRRQEVFIGNDGNFKPLCFLSNTKVTKLLVVHQFNFDGLFYLRIPASPCLRVLLNCQICHGELLASGVA
ncbi:MAG: hypothetical protein F6J96_28590 [Symploca sp. SIO1C2]|nr:hypothetical protein [Symploca sp. SIO1C2]